tara:strand:- start:2505 stop:2897 length:393 start_codon:yes stop_codon:yes gene_type:complete
MKYLNHKDYSTFTDEDSGEEIKLILMSGVRKLIKYELIKYSLTLESVTPMTLKGKESLHVIVKCTASNLLGSLETFASASPLTTNSNYIIEMAEKRALARAVLMLLGIYDTYKGADEFSAKPKPLSIPKV